MTVKCPVNPNGRLEETAAMMEKYMGNYEAEEES